MRLIDADALTEELKEWLKDKELHRGLGTAIEDISRMPTVEAKPIIHAKWVSKIPGSIFGECSHCNYGCGSYSYEYCPHCGARMDGGKFERVEKGEKYYFVDVYRGKFYAKHEVDENSILDDEIYASNNYFLTRERAEEVANKINFLLKLERLHDVYCPDYKPDWDDGKYKWYVFFDKELESYNFTSDLYWNKKVATYFDSEETANKVCEILNKELENEDM